MSRCKQYLNVVKGGHGVSDASVEDSQVEVHTGTSIIRLCHSGGVNGMEMGLMGGIGMRLKGGIELGLRNEIEGGTGSRKG